MKRAGRHTASTPRASEAYALTLPGSEAADAVAGAQKRYAALWAGLQKQLSGALQSDDPERIHGVRTASRRLASTLILFQAGLPKEEDGRCQLKYLRKILRATSALRDMDVQIDFTKKLLRKIKAPALKGGVACILKHLDQSRDKQWEKVRA